MNSRTCSNALSHEELSDPLHGGWRSGWWSLVVAADGACSCIWPLGLCRMTYPLRPGQCLGTSQRWSPGVIIASRKDKQGQHLGKDQSTSLPRLAENQSPMEDLHSFGLADLYLNKLAPSVRHIIQSAYIIEGNVSALKELLKEQRNRDLIKPMLLNFGDDFQDTGDEIIKSNKKKEKGKETVGDEDLRHRMPMNAKIYDGTGVVEDHVSESNAIPNVPELMQISSFMSSHKCPELLKCFSDSIPKIVNEMLKSVDDYVRSEEAFCKTKLPKARDLSEEALIVKAEVEGYLVRRIHIDEGASIEIMYEHCFNMLHPSIKARLAETQTIIYGSSREHVKSLGKIELDVCFGGSRLCRRAIMKFNVILAPSPYNIILGCPSLKQLRDIPSTIYGMMKLPTP
ncbi:reverse transcriptase domain-containing protein [Tanacetum coccineum]